jgi:hypothetical protein
MESNFLYKHNTCKSFVLNKKLHTQAKVASILRTVFITPQLLTITPQRFSFII